MNEVLFSYITDTGTMEEYKAKWDPIECVWIGEDDQPYDTIDQILTEIQLADGKNVNYKVVA